MNNNKYFILIFLKITFNSLNAQVEYPKTIKKEIVNNYHGVKVIDNYQWLEEIGSPQVVDWVKQQNKLAKKYLNKLNKNGSRRLIKKFKYHEMNYDSLTKADRNKKLYFTLMYPSPNSTPAIYYSKGNYGGYERLISPNSISSKDQIIFTSLKPSFDERFLAYQYSRNGSDWKEIKIVQLKKRHYFKETIKHTISSEIYWFGQGFFYKKYPIDSTNGKRIFPQIMYHKLGTKQLKDKLVFNVDNENESLRIYGTPKQNLFVIKRANHKSNNFSYYYLNNYNNLEFKSLFKDINYDMDIVRYKSDTIIAITRIKKKKCLISFPLNNPKKWKVLSPSYSGAVLTDYEIMDDKIVTSFQSEKSSIISVTNYNGEVLGEVLTPDGLSASDLFYSYEYNELNFKLSSYTVPPVRCKLDFNNFSYKYLGKTEVSFDAKGYKFIRKKFISHDGVEVPMFIVYKDSLNKNGSTPFLLKTYGGYGTIAKPSFNPGIIYFIENGGAFAYVHVRGGGEFGQNWWNSGKNMKKNNTILDFTSAAEFLIEEGYTQPKKIAATGSSHGGLVVAAAIIKKPELFGSAVIDVGVLDMLRFEKSEVGSKYTNISEFGSVKVKEEFKNLFSYSPFHNIDYKVNYPSMLIVTGSNDNRVPPYHSYKFTAKLQNNPNQKNNIILWSQKEAGHYGANEYNSKIEELTFIYGFLFEELKKD